MKNKLAKISVIIVLIIFLALIIWLFVLEGTKYNPPKTFHLEDKKATYLIALDQNTGMYRIEGTNGIPQGGFSTWISKESVDITPYLGKRVSLDGRFTISKYAELECAPNNKLCEGATQSPGVAAFIITNIREVK